MTTQVWCHINVLNTTQRLRLPYLMMVLWCFFVILEHFKNMYVNTNCSLVTRYVRSNAVWCHWLKTRDVRLIEIKLQSRFETLRFTNRKACDVDEKFLYSRANAIWVADLLTNRVSAPPFSPISTALANCVNAHHYYKRKKKREWKCVCGYGVYRVRSIVSKKKYVIWDYFGFEMTYTTKKT